MKYRLLKAGETIRWGDEWNLGNGGNWAAAFDSVGKVLPQCTAYLYRRPVASRVKHKTHNSLTTKSILSDYNDFRHVRAVCHIRKSDWLRMTNRTRSALGRMVNLASKAVREGKL